MELDLNTKHLLGQMSREFKGDTKLTGIEGRGKFVNLSTTLLGVSPAQALAAYNKSTPGQPSQPPTVK